MSPISKLQSYVYLLLHLLILWDLYKRTAAATDNFLASSVTRLALMAGLLAAPVVVSVLSWQGLSQFQQYHGSTLFLQMTFCLVICRELVHLQKEVNLGQNLKGMFCGMSLLVGLQAINFIGVSSQHISPQTFGFLVQYIYFLALIVFTYTLWDYAPISGVDSQYYYRLKKANGQLFEVLKGMLLNRK